VASWHWQFLEDLATATSPEYHPKRFTLKRTRRCFTLEKGHLRAKMKILIVEDDQRIAIPLKEELQHQNYVVDMAIDGSEGLEMAMTGQYDIIVLDLMLPKLSGFSVCKQLRDNGNSAAILMLTARSDKKDKVVGLDCGADDYLTKPFDLDELSARVRALSRRSISQRKSVISCGPLEIDTVSCAVTFREKVIDVTPTEYRLLAHFALNPTATFNGEELLDKLWSQDSAGGKETIKTHIKTLRKKLVAAGIKEEVIETVYGFGYRLKNNA